MGGYGLVFLGVGLLVRMLMRDVVLVGFWLDVGCRFLFYTMM